MAYSSIFTNENESEAWRVSQDLEKEPKFMYEYTRHAFVLTLVNIMAIFENPRYRCEK